MGVGSSRSEARSEGRHAIPLQEAVSHVLEECRMILPGVQALFGFQLIAVFNSTFSTRLTGTEQRLHLAALGLVAIAGALVMAPAAYHRQTGPTEVSLGLVKLASRLLLAAMIPLMTAIGLDFYLIARLVLDSRLVSLLLTLILLSVFSALWFVLPRVSALERLLRS